MGMLGLALPWESRISQEPRYRESRVQPAETNRVSFASAEVSSDDASLAAACQAGDLRAFERLYQAHASRMKSMARNLLGGASDAEDAVQDTFLKIHRSIGSFRGQSSFATWMFRILINTCYDARRSRVRKKEISQDDEPEGSQRPEPRAASSHPALRLVLEHALTQLTRHQRDVFLLYEVEGFRHSEIAEMLDISETASKNTLFQAKRNLRQLLEAPRGAAAEAR